jgi:hypothetical protein
MTYAEAMEVRLRHAQRQPVDREDLELANRVVTAVRQMQTDIPEPERVVISPPAPAQFPVLSRQPAEDDQQVRLLLGAVDRIARPRVAREPDDRPRPGRWRTVDAMVLTHDRKSLALGQMHKVPVQAIDFYP